MATWEFLAPLLPTSESSLGHVISIHSRTPFQENNERHVDLKGANNKGPQLGSGNQAKSAQRTIGLQIAPGQ